MADISKLEQQAENKQKDSDIIKAWNFSKMVAINIGSVTLSKNDVLAIDGFINRQNAEIENLRKEKDNLIKTYKECMTEAIKDFAERLCKDRVSNDPVVIAVKVELKEMVGE
jgi:hypothetical protein